jgi:hypothetical protein
MPSTRSDSPDYALCKPLLPSDPLFFVRFLTAPIFSDHSSFVNGRTRDVIMVEMRQRIDRGDIDREIAETVQVCAEPLLSPTSPRKPTNTRAGDV